MREITSMTDKPKLPPHLAVEHLIQGEPLVENHNVQRSGNFFLVDGTPQEDRLALLRKVDDLLTDVCITDTLASYPLIKGRFLIVYPPYDCSIELLNDGQFARVAAIWSMH